MDFFGKALVSRYGKFNTRLSVWDHLAWGNLGISLATVCEQYGVDLEAMFGFIWAGTNAQNTASHKMGVLACYDSMGFKCSFLGSFTQLISSVFK